MLTTVEYMDTPLLTTGDVAEMLDAHPSSVKRWASDGDLNCITTSGGHRRFKLEDVRKFSKKAGVPFLFAPLEEDLGAYLTALKASSDELDRALLNLFFRWFIDSKTNRAEWALQHLRRTRYTVGSLFDRVIAPLMEQVGFEWQTGRLSVAVEHQISQQVLEGLYRLRPDVSETSDDRPLAICAGAENALHILPLMAARLILESRGWKVIFLGAAVPNEDLMEIVLAKRPHIVCVSFSPPLNADDVYRTAKTLARARGVHPFHTAFGGKPADGFDTGSHLADSSNFANMTAFEQWALNLTLNRMNRESGA